MKEDISNLMIVHAFYETITYATDSLPAINEIEFYQLKEDLILQLSNGVYIRYSLYYKDYSIIKISLLNEFNSIQPADNENLKNIFFQRIERSEYYYIQNTYIYQRTTYVSDIYMPEEDLGAICLFFENGRKLIILSGEVEESNNVNCRLPYKVSQ